VLADISYEQKCNLAEIIAEQEGGNADFETFCDCLLGLFEDIPGFESAPPGEALTREIWMIYRDAITVGEQASRQI
jgi:hypothetical protein